MNGKLLLLLLLCFMLSNVPNSIGRPGAQCQGQIRDFVCGWEPGAPQCPSGYNCFRIHATGEYVCCWKLDLGWRRRRRRNENKKDNGKTEFRRVTD